MAKTLYIVLNHDGRHAIMALRGSELTAEHIASEAQTLRAGGACGWICRMEGEYYGKRRITITPVADLCEPGCDFEIAAARFSARRTAMIVEAVR